MKIQSGEPFGMVYRGVKFHFTVTETADYKAVAIVNVEGVFVCYGIAQDEKKHKIKVSVEIESSNIRAINSAYFVFLGRRLCVEDFDFKAVSESAEVAAINAYLGSINKP